MNNIIILSQSNPDSSLISPHEEVTPQLSYFDTITNRLNSWDSKQAAIREQKNQLTKSFTLEDVDELTQETKVYQLSITLIRTFKQEQVDVLELPEMEDHSYAN